MCLNCNNDELDPEENGEGEVDSFEDELPGRISFLLELLIHVLSLIVSFNVSTCSHIFILIKKLFNNLFIKLLPIR